MKYKVSYKCKVGNETFDSNFEVESDNRPELNDSVLVNSALKDSVKFCKNGLCAITIISVHKKE